MNIPASIFKAYDVRGEYPGDFNEVAAGAIALVTARFLNAKTMVVSMDNRASSPSLKEEVVKALRGEGVRVIDAGMTTTPLFYFSVGVSRTDGGIMVTASHNPASNNGLKIVRAGAEPVGIDSGLAWIRDAAMHGQDGSRGTDGGFETADFLPAYLDFLVQGKRFPHLKIVADAGCGTVGEVFSEFAKRAGIELIPLCFAPCKKQSHEGNPLKDENVKDIQGGVVEHRADIGVAFDTDADRVFFFGASGERIPTHAVAAMLVTDMLERQKGAPAVYGANMPHVFRDAIAAAGGVPVESKVGHANIKHTMREQGGIFGCEISGHYFFKDFFFADSGMVTLAHVLDIVGRKDMSLAELAKPFLKRVQSGELNYAVADRDAALEAVEKAFPDASISKLDGITAEYDAWWCNVRVSNTEPLVRVNIEADSREVLESARARIEKVIQG